MIACSPLPPQARRGRLGASSAALAGAFLAASLFGCSSSPPVHLYQLRADPPADALSAAPSPSASVPTGGAVSGRWTLGPVTLPEYLDRDALVLPTGQASLTPLPGHRWAEPLRDAVPRLLQQDLATLRGADQVWRNPVPPGIKADRQLRVEIQQFEARPDGRGVTLRARWMLVDPAGQVPALVRDSRIDAAATDGSPDALVSAHRAALWQLAQDIAARARGG